MQSKKKEEKLASKSRKRHASLIAHTWQQEEDRLGMKCTDPEEKIKNEYNQMKIVLPQWRLAVEARKMATLVSILQNR